MLLGVMVVFMHDLLVVRWLVSGTPIIFSNWVFVRLCLNNKFIKKKKNLDFFLFR